MINVASKRQKQRERARGEKERETYTQIFRGGDGDREPGGKKQSEKDTQIYRVRDGERPKEVSERELKTQTHRDRKRGGEGQRPREKQTERGLDQEG